MARKPFTLNAGGQSAFFAALAQLTYREMLDVAGLLGLQLREGGAPALEPGEIARALADAAESFGEAEADDS